jgi:hypothetical protein
MPSNLADGLTAKVSVQFFFVLLYFVVFSFFVFVPSWFKVDCLDLLQLNK